MADAGGSTNAPARGRAEVEIGRDGRPLVADSWRRCVDRYRFDPSAKLRVSALTSHELRERRDPFDELLAAVEEEILHVAEPLSAASFSVSFADMAGIVLYYRSDRALGNYVEVERAGTLWAEGAAGTNGVGTCVVTRRPVQVFKNEHFFRDFSHLSCCAAPVMSPEGDMLGVLNFTTGDPDVSEGAFRLASGLVARTADRLGDQLFRRQHRRDALLAAQGDGGALLLALDGDQTLVGANAAAKRWLNLGHGSFAPRSLWDVFEASGASGFSAEEGRVRLTRGGEVRDFDLFAGPRFPPSAPVAREAKPAAAPRSGRAAAADPSAGPSVETCLGGGARAEASLRLLRRVVGSRLPILLLGETGVGKDTLARALHREGDRSGRPFVAFNCAAVPESLIDSELFGYGSGAFTGARRDGAQGRLAEADGGTLFLDEIGDMPLGLQTRLLRVLETGEVSPLGAAKARQVDLQVIAATNHDVRRRVAEGLFRADLYHRLAAVVIDLPALRERSDRAALIRALFERARGPREIALSPSAMAALMAHSWPGNVRELSYVLQRAALICDGGEITVADLMLEPIGAQFHPRQMAAPDAPEEGTARGAVVAAEKRAIEDALAANVCDVAKSARALKISRATLYRKLRQHGIDPRARAV